jgi:hypothetical protein
MDLKISNNIDEEIKNITSYINKIETSIIKENNKLLTQNEIIMNKNKLESYVKKIDNKLIEINNNINIFNNNEKKKLLKEERIYNNELIRINEKKQLLKEQYNIELNNCIKYGINLYLKKRNILMEIKYFSDKIEEFNNKKKELRFEYINNIKNNNSIIKERKKKQNEINDLKSTLNKLEDEINLYSFKKNKIISSKFENKLINNERNNNINEKLSLLNIEQRKLIKKRDKLSKYLKTINPQLSNINTPLLKKKLPPNYKEYKTILTNKKIELKKYNIEINNHLNKLYNIEYYITDEYINSILFKEKERCILRWNKTNERFNYTINNYKQQFINQINELQKEKIQIQHQLSLLDHHNISNKKETEINNNNELLSNIKNRLNYLKNMKKNK